MRLDLDLDGKVSGRRLEQLVKEERALGRRPTVAVAQEAPGDLSGSPLVGPPPERRSELEQWVVEENQLVVGGQANVGLEPVDASAEGALKRPRRGVRTVRAPEPVRVEGRGGHVPNGTGRPGRLLPGRHRRVMFA